MSIALWVVQILLAIVFLLTGGMKLTQSKEQLDEAGFAEFALSTVRLIGVLELLGAIGVVLPAVTGILPWLTPLAAVGLALTMIGAAITHLRRGEYPNIVVNLIIFALAVFVGRTRLIDNMEIKAEQ